MKSIVESTDVFRIDGLKIACRKYDGGSGGPPSVLSLHGAGQSGGQRIAYLLKELAQTGLTGCTFDFAGHGLSDGKMSDSSLTFRENQALAAIEHFGFREIPILLASSMGAHVAATLSKKIRVGTLTLFVPAAYSRKAQSLAFGGGFTEAIREPESYLDSMAYDAISEFTGRIIVICGTEDHIIPEAVVNKYVDNAKASINREALWLDGVGHQIHAYLADNEIPRQRIIRRIIDGLAE